VVYPSPPILLQITPFNPATPVKPGTSKRVRRDPGTPTKKYAFSTLELAPGQYKVPQLLKELNISHGTWTDIQTEVAAH